MWWTSAVVVDLPLVPVMPTTLCGGKVGAGQREEFDVADDGDASRACLGGERVGVERNAGGHDQGVEAGQIVEGGDRQKPLPFRGGVGVRATGVGLDETLPTPNPSPEGEGL